MNAERVIIREGTEQDLPAVVALLAADPLGRTREIITEGGAAPEYLRAFEAMSLQTGNTLLVAVARGRVVGCLQLMILPGLSRGGATRGQIEGVRVSDAHRGKGIGEQLVRAAVEKSIDAGCALVQLTTDVSRDSARGFYERLGFEATHVGMKRIL